jgi:hypothetical protein
MSEEIVNASKEAFINQTTITITLKHISHNLKLKH